MEKNAFISYYLILAFLVGIYITIKFAIRKLACKVEEKNCKITFDELEKKCMQHLQNKKIDNIKLVFAPFYCFDAQNNILKILKKNIYTNYDLFICYHEIGHAIDFNGKYKKLYKLITKLKIVFYVFWLPILGVDLCLYFERIQVRNIVIVLNLIEIAVGFVIIEITAFIEYRASKYAITVFGKLNKQRLQLYKIAKISILEQIVYWLIIMHSILFALCCIA